MGDEISYCLDCRASTVTVFDRTTGDCICTECGLVLEARMVDETQEWRQFADDSRSNDPNRVGGRVNPLLDDGSPETIVISTSSGGGRTSSLPRSVNLKSERFVDPKRALVRAFDAISAMSDRLCLLTTIKDRAKEIYKSVEKEKILCGRSQDAFLAACLFVACRLEHTPRTMNEICTVANGAPKKKIGQYVSRIESELTRLGQSKEDGVINPGVFLRRFCSSLGLPNETVKVAQEVIKNLDDIDIRRSPVSVAAAVIYMMTQLSNIKKPLKDIALATGVSENTIKKAYSDIYPYASLLVPSSFANNGTLSCLSQP
ncbi:transcription initiation factor IIB-like [Typha angustifolia]|uniref:transcription initiation factor IIB-like n=1 Tax=Typha angustifolia TaxID=59011 RepID=UPI003C2DC571